ncbi:hypothetical protein BASA61_000785 [Batrachochytrium salamandrivorans]|nr:hypothetical protein BASA61_000785 [Batrachochytrium salamandrivorans]
MAMGSLTRGRPSHRERERLKLNTNPMNIAVGAASLAVAPAAESTHEVLPGELESSRPISPALLSSATASVLSGNDRHLGLWPLSADLAEATQMQHPGSPGIAVEATSSTTRIEAVAGSYKGPQANLAFNPQPTQSSKCSKLKLKLVLDKTLYVAGGKLQGRVEVTSFSHNNLYLGDISIELKGSEELTDANPISQIFLSSRITLQGDRLPQTRAVRGTCKDGYWQANKGKTVFPFTFLLPEDAPSSYTFQSIASLKYMLTGVVQYELRGKRDTLLKITEAIVLDKVDPLLLQDGMVNERGPHLSAESTQRLKGFFNNDTGFVKLEASIESALVQSGNDVFVDIRVINSSSRKVQGLKVSLVKKLLILNNDHGDMITNGKSGTKSAALTTVKDVCATASEASLRYKTFIYDANEDRTSRVHLHIPSLVRTIRRTTLAEVECFINVSLGVGSLFGQDLFVEIPVTVCHALSSSISDGNDDINSPQHEDRAMSPCPRGRSAMAMSTSPMPPQSPTSILSRSPSPTSPRLEPTSPWKMLGMLSQVRSMSPPPVASRRQAAVVSPGVPTRILPWSDDEEDSKPPIRSELSSRFGRRLFSGEKRTTEQPSQKKASVPLSTATMSPKVSVASRLTPSLFRSAPDPSNPGPLGTLTSSPEIPGRVIQTELASSNLQEVPTTLSHSIPSPINSDHVVLSSPHQPNIRQQRQFKPLPSPPVVSGPSKAIQKEDATQFSRSVVSTLYNGLINVGGAFVSVSGTTPLHEQQPASKPLPLPVASLPRSTLSRLTSPQPNLTQDHSKYTHIGADRIGQRSVSPPHGVRSTHSRLHRPLPRPKRHPRQPPVLSDLDVKWDDTNASAAKVSACEMSKFVKPSNALNSIDPHPILYQEFLKDLDQDCSGSKTSTWRTGIPKAHIDPSVQ